MQHKPFILFCSGKPLTLLIIVLLLFTAGCAGFKDHQKTKAPQPGKSADKGEAWLEDARQAAEKAGKEKHPNINQSGKPSEPPAAGDAETADKTGPPASVVTGDTDNPDTEPAAENKTETAAQQAAIQKKIDQALEYYAASQDFWQQGELDNALHALDQAYERIMSADSSETAKFIQQKDDLRYMISKRILEIYASRHTTARGNHNAIPHEMNEEVRREVKFFTEGKGRRFFVGAYKRSGQYRPFILEELKKAGLPADLSWIPLIESGFKTKALSRARALGLWQFISSTAYKYGLERNRYIDERLDPYASTHAAIDYLKELHGIFGDWTTVLAGYNCGEYRVLRTIRTQNVNYLDNFWDLYRLLPRETARYVPKFLAALHIIDNLEKYGMEDIQVDPPLRFETVQVEKQMHLKDIAKALNVDKSRLFHLNPELRYKLLPEATYKLKVPQGKRKILLAKLDQIPEFTQTAPGIAYHRVRPGETLSTIADRYKTTISQIARYNDIRRKHYIVAGKILKIPHSGDVEAGTARTSPTTYTVRRGDSLWTLAKRYDTTTKKIQAMNNLDAANLYIGQKLKIPAGTTPATYQVKRGDSPYTIAKKHNMNVNKLLRANNLSKHSTIYPGQRLYLR